MRYHEIVLSEAETNAMIRVHLSNQRITDFRTDGDYTQNARGRKPNGFWWADGDSWHAFVQTAKPKGKRLSGYRYRVEIDRSKCRLLQLTDWQSILDFSIQYGTTVAGLFWWQKGEQKHYDPAEDTRLADHNVCHVPMINWAQVARSYDAIEVPNYDKAHPGRPHVEWLDIDWDVPSGCAFRLNGISITPL